MLQEIYLLHKRLPLELCEELSRELAEACSKPPELTELTEAPAFAKALEVAAAKVKKVKVDRQVLEEQLHEKDLELLEAERELRLKRSEDASREARLRYKLGLDGDTGAIPEHKIYDVVMMPATGQRPTSAERVMSNSSSPLMSPRRSSVPSSPPTPVYLLKWRPRGTCVESAR